MKRRKKKKKDRERERMHARVKNEHIYGQIFTLVHIVRQSIAKQMENKSIQFDFTGFELRGFFYEH